LVTPTGALTSGIGVMISRTGVAPSVTNRMSRLVTMPTRVPWASVTGTPEIRYRAQSASTSRNVSSGLQVTGFVTMPASERLTRSTWRAWSSIERLRCRTPMPPCRAIAMAIRASVTVSMGLETSGIARVTERLSRVVVLTRLGMISDSAGCNSTSSKVSPSGTTRAEPAGSSGRCPASCSAPVPSGRSLVGPFSTMCVPWLLLVWTILADGGASASNRSDGLVGTVGASAARPGWRRDGSSYPVGCPAAAGRGRTGGAGHNG